MFVLIDPSPRNIPDQEGVKPQVLLLKSPSVPALKQHCKKFKGDVKVICEYTLPRYYNKCQSYHFTGRKCHSVKGRFYEV